ncbi:hypothetical protein FWK35_00031607 [Aphis craccivora]|uniref:Uncharacterized protein n=1 Tax=Aphis craccivora TaxID=307492 RepID=A0A6G0YNL7_APHCR|nr:hypothetical protein FWK35_00031607 [Aphis craccivora]
MTINKSQGQ